MSGWHAVVPIKPIAERKTRLRGRFSDDKVEALSERMLHHVVTTLRGNPIVRQVTLLAEQPHRSWPIDWLPDPGGGLNAALREAANAFPFRLLVMHADLPALCDDDVEALFVGASAGAAIAPDRHGIGTNALALHDARGFDFAFGPDSFARHREMLPGAVVVDRDGLAFDIDFPADLALLAARRDVTP